MLKLYSTIRNVTTLIFDVFKRVIITIARALFRSFEFFVHLYSFISFFYPLFPYLQVLHSILNSLSMLNASQPLHKLHSHIFAI